TVTLSEVWKLGSSIRSKKFSQPTYLHPFIILIRDTSCSEMYMFQKSGNIRKIRSIVNAGVRNRYGSALENIFQRTPYMCV
ncbi:MAG TPA: hypothetical protein VFJ05_00940, partial [Nitrososphaeraceae archaeon]|nr:hypothetical protein [Nitrososphaeraceae archaeon]